MLEDDPIALVRLAISMHRWHGCLEYENRDVFKRLEIELIDLAAPDVLKDLLVEHAARDGPIERRQEIRPEYQSRRECWFRVLVPIAGRPKPLFFELDLVDDDPECPSVTILNIHF